LGYLRFRVRPFNSEVHSASALLPCSHPAVIPDRLLGSLEIALKRTRPRRRIYVIGRYSMTEGEKSQEMKDKGGRTISLKLSRYSSSLQHAAIWIDRTLLAVAVVEDAREEPRDG
jgi:hypothetical protein